MKVTGYLVVKANGSLRVVKTRPTLAFDEMAFQLNVTIPTTWGAFASQKIEVVLPDPPEPIVEVTGPEVPAFGDPIPAYVIGYSHMEGNRMIGPKHAVKTPYPFPQIALCGEKIRNGIGAPLYPFDPSESECCQTCVERLPRG